jgi:hypothetical protein
LPRAVRRREHLLDPHALHAVPQWLTVDLVAVAEKIGWGGVVRGGVHELLGGPVGGGVLGHVEVDDPPAAVSEHDEDEEDAEASGGNGEKVDRDHVADVVEQSLPPAGPDFGQPDPQQAVGRAQPRPGRRSLVDGELLAQGQVLEGELTRAADEKGEEPE